MSSQTDIQALKAKIARLEAELEVEREYSSSRIKELEQTVKQLEIDKRLSTPKLNDRAAQRGVSTDASDPAQRAENSQLRDELATSDAELATKDAPHLSPNLFAAEPAADAVLGPLQLSPPALKAAKPAVATSSDLFQFPEYRPSPFLQSAAKPSAATISGPPQPSPFAQIAAKPSAATAPGPPQPTSSAQMPAKSTPRISTRRARFNQVPFKPKITHAELSAKKKEASPEPQRQQTHKPSRILQLGDQRGGGYQAKCEDPRPGPSQATQSTHAARAAREKAAFDRAMAIDAVAFFENLLNKKEPKPSEPLNPTGNPTTSEPAQEFDDVVRMPENKSLSPPAKGFHSFFRLSEQTPTRPPLPKGFVNNFSGIREMTLEELKASNAQSSANVLEAIGPKKRRADEEQPGTSAPPKRPRNM